MKHSTNKTIQNQIQRQSSLTMKILKPSYKTKQIKRKIQQKKKSVNLAKKHLTLQEVSIPTKSHIAIKVLMPSHKSPGLDLLSQV